MAMKWIVAALLVVAFAGCAEEAPEPEVEVTENETAEILAPSTIFFNRTGSLTSVVAGPVDALASEDLVEFFVPFGTARVDASVAANSPVLTLQIMLPDTMGTVEYTMDGQTSRASVVNPVPGNYTAIVSSDLAIATDYELSIAVAPDNKISNLLSETVTIGPGQFFEVNLVMQLGDELHWDWTASSTSDYNVHTHFDGEVQYLVEESSTAHADMITANRTGGHSFMWDNPGTTPQTVTYKAWGTFEVDSYFPPRS